MSLIEREKAEQIVSETNLPALAAREFREYEERFADSFEYFFPLNDDIGRTGRDYFLALIGAQRTIPQEACTQEFAYNEEGSIVPNWLYVNDQISLAEQLMVIDEQVVGATYTAFRS